MSGKLTSSSPYPSPGSSSDIDHVSRQQPPPPMPYAFIPSYNDTPQAYRDPPTPTSLPDTDPSPSRATSSKRYIDSLVDDILGKAQPQSSNGQTTPIRSSTNGQAPTQTPVVTPTIARTLASTKLTTDDLESPDPLAMSGPSPSKRAKHAARRASPTPAGSGAGASTTSSIPNLKRRPSTDGHSGTKRLIPEVVISAKTRSSVPDIERRQTQVSDEEDDVDWGDNGGQDASGDWDMDDPLFRSPSPNKRVGEPGSGRTGERDHRSVYSRFSQVLHEVTHLLQLQRREYRRYLTTSGKRTIPFLPKSRSIPSLHLVTSHHYQTSARYLYFPLGLSPS